MGFSISGCFFAHRHSDEIATKHAIAPANSARDLGGVMISDYSFLGFVNAEVIQTVGFFMFGGRSFHTFSLFVLQTIHIFVIFI